MNRELNCREFFHVSCVNSFASARPQSEGIVIRWCKIQKAEWENLSRYEAVMNDIVSNWSDSNYKDPLFSLTVRDHATIQASFSHLAHIKLQTLIFRNQFYKSLNV